MLDPVKYFKNAFVSVMTSGDTYRTDQIYNVSLYLMLLWQFVLGVLLLKDWKS